MSALLQARIAEEGLNGEEAMHYSQLQNFFAGRE
jgi:hypothetical protein